MPYTADHPGSSWVALTPMRWETEEGRWAQAGGLREAGVFNTRGLCHPGRGPRVYRGSEMSRLGLGFVRRRSRGLGEGSVCTWGFGPPAWLSSRPGSRREARRAGQGGAPGHPQCPGQGGRRRCRAHRCRGTRRCGDTGSCRARRTGPRSGRRRSTRSGRTGTRPAPNTACRHPPAGTAACRSASPWSSCSCCRS